MKAHAWRRLAGLMVASVLLLMAGCGDDDKESGPAPYPSQTSQANVMAAFQRAWNEKNFDEYSKLLAEDFQFYFDPQTRMAKQLPLFWTRLQDSSRVARLFSSDRVADISLRLTFQTEFKADTLSAHSRWTYIDVLDVFLDVDLAPTPEDPEGVTYRVEDQRQRFYFRTGITQADTLATSATASLYYMVGWIDYGIESLSASGGNRPAAGQMTSWSGIKTLFDD